VHPTGVRDAMPDHRPQSGVRHHIKEATRGWILVDDGLDIFPEKMKHLFSSYRCGTQGATTYREGIFAHVP
jgi:hypothetical protein